MSDATTKARRGLLPTLIIIQAGFCIGFTLGNLFIRARASTPIPAITVTAAGGDFLNYTMAGPTWNACSAEEASMLYTLGQVESGNDYTAVNKAGDRFGKYQMSVDVIVTWLRHEPIWREVEAVVDDACVMIPADQDACALFHIRELQNPLLPFDPAAIARHWNPDAGQDYVDRVLNLYHTQL